MIVGGHAPKIERYVAELLCGYLRKLHGIHTEPVVNLITPQESRCWWEVRQTFLRCCVRWE